MELASMESLQDNPQEAPLAAIGTVAMILSALGRNLFQEALDSPPEGLTPHAQAAIQSVVATRLSGTTNIALEFLKNVFIEQPTLEEGEENTRTPLTWESLGIRPTAVPDQPVEQARDLTLKALLAYTRVTLSQLEQQLGGLSALLDALLDENGNPRS